MQTMNPQPESTQAQPQPTLDNLRVAIERHEIEKIQSILLQNKAYLNAFIEIGEEEHITPLCLAARIGDRDSVTLLLNLGADPFQPTLEGELPLHIAAMRGYENALEFILSQMVKNKDATVINLMDNKKRTALHLAAANGWERVVRKLITHGVDVDLMDINQKTAYDLAIEARDAESARRIDNPEEGAKQNLDKKIELLNNILATLENPNKLPTQPILSEHMKPSTKLSEEAERFKNRQAYIAKAKLQSLLNREVLYHKLYFDLEELKGILEPCQDILMRYDNLYGVLVSEKLIDTDISTDTELLPKNVLTQDIQELSMIRQFAFEQQSIISSVLLDRHSKVSISPSVPSQNKPKSPASSSSSSSSSSQQNAPVSPAKSQGVISSITSTIHSIFPAKPTVSPSAQRDPVKFKQSLASISNVRILEYQRELSYFISFIDLLQSRLTEAMKLREVVRTLHHLAKNNELAKHLFRPHSEISKLLIYCYETDQKQLLELDNVINLQINEVLENPHPTKEAVSKVFEEQQDLLTVVLTDIVDQIQALTKLAVKQRDINRIHQEDEMVFLDEIQLLTQKIDALKEDQNTLLIEPLEKEKKKQEEKKQLLVEQSCWLFYKTLRLKLVELLLGCKVACSNLVASEIKEVDFNDDLVAKVGDLVKKVTGIAEAVPVVKIVAKLVKMGINKGLEHHNHEKFTHLSLLAIGLNDIETLAEETALRATKTYKEQISKLEANEGGAATLAKSASDRIFSYLWKHNGVEEPKDLAETFVWILGESRKRMGFLHLKDVHLSTKTHENYWTDKGVFRESGIVTELGNYYVRKEGVKESLASRSDLYGYRLGTESYAKSAGLILSQEHAPPSSSSSSEVVSPAKTDVGQLRLSRAQARQLSLVSDKTASLSVRLHLLEQHMQRKYDDRGTQLQDIYIPPQSAGNGKAPK